MVDIQLIAKHHILVFSFVFLSCEVNSGSEFDYFLLQVTVFAAVLTRDYGRSSLYCGSVVAPSVHHFCIEDFFPLYYVFYSI